VSRDSPVPFCLHSMRTVRNAERKNQIKAGEGTFDNLDGLGPNPPESGCPHKWGIGGERGNDRTATTGGGGDVCPGRAPSRGPAGERDHHFDRRLSWDPSRVVDFGSSKRRPFGAAPAPIRLPVIRLADAAAFPRGGGAGRWRQAWRDGSCLVIAWVMAGSREWLSAEGFAGCILHRQIELGFGMAPKTGHHICVKLAIPHP